MTRVPDATNASPFTLRHATSADLDAIHALERATGTAPHWPRAAYAAILEPQDSGSPRRCLLVAERHKTIIGFAAALAQDAEATAEIETVAVAASSRREGIGRALCVAVLDWCRRQRATSILLEVRASSVDAVALYTSLGFACEGRRSCYYRDPDEDALILRYPFER